MTEFHKVDVLVSSSASRSSRNGAGFISNHIMMVTEFAPCGSLTDTIKKRPELQESDKALSLGCILSAVDTTTEKSLSTSVALYDAQPQRRRYVFAERCVSLCLTATPPTLEGQPNLLLDEVADVTTVVKVTTAPAVPSTCRRGCRRPLRRRCALDTEDWRRCVVIDVRRPRWRRFEPAAFSCPVVKVSSFGLIWNSNLLF